MLGRWPRSDEEEEAERKREAKKGRAARTSEGAFSDEIRWKERIWLPNS